MTNMNEDLRVKETNQEESGELIPKQPTEPQKDGLVIRQFFACSCAYLIAMSNGASSGFSAVTIPQLQDKKEGFSLTNEEISWFASLFTFAQILTCVIGGIMSQHLGSKRSLLITAPISIVAFSLQALAPNKEVLLVGRFLVGVAAGLSSAPATTYVSELPSPNWRTTFGSGIGGFYLIGSLIIFILGSILSWRMVAALSGLFSVFGLAIGMLVPESPNWLKSKGFIGEAEEANKWMNGTSKRSFFVGRKRDLVQIQKCSEADESLLQSMKDSSLASKKEDQTCCSKFWNLTTKFFSKLSRADIWKPLIIMIILGFSQPFSGINTVFYYAVTLLMNTASGVNEYLATIVFGLTRVLAALVGSVLLLRFERRHLFIISSILTGLGMLMLGFSPMSDTLKSSSVDANQTHLNSFENQTFDNDSSETEMTFMNYLPVLSIVLAAIGYHIGLSPITWSYMGELYPQDVRAEMAGFSNCIANIGAFLVVKTYPMLSSPDHLGFQGSMCFYASVCVINLLVGIFILPETKGKRLEEINDKFNNKV